MREIRENVRYRPARDRYKVFIIDEAHQITKEAFNALLKTLEEPPEWVVFILCTTEAYEIPNTIASRCQHFSFRSVDFVEVMNRMRYIVKEEGIEADDDVLAVVAHAGEGSVRDSLSAFDQAIACCGKTLRVEDVRALLGVFAVASLRSVAEAVQQQNGAAHARHCAGTGRNRPEPAAFFARAVALLAQSFGRETRRQAHAAHLRVRSGTNRRCLKPPPRFSEEDLTRYLNLSLDLYKNLQSSLQPRLHLELGLIKLVQAGRLQSIESALAGLEKVSAANRVRHAHLRRGRPAFQAPASSRSAPLEPPPASHWLRRVTCARICMPRSPKKD